MADSYFTVRSGAEVSGEFEDRKSRFIAQLVHVESVDEAQAHQAAMRARRAYTAAAQAAVEAARAAGDIVEMTSVVNVDVPVAYPLYEQVVRIIADTGGKIAGTDYTDQVLIHAIYREGEHEALRPLLTELMAGKEVVEVGKAHFDEF